VASASVLVTTNPIFIALLGYFFLRERLSRITVVAIGIGVLGAVFIGWGDTQGGSGSNPLLGNTLALTASFVFAIYLLIGRVVRQTYSWLAYVFPLYVVVALTALVMALVLQAPLWGFSRSFYGLCAVMALGPSIAGHGSFNYAVRYFPAALLGLLGLLEPVLASLAAYVFFDEVPSGIAIGGMVLVFIGVTVAMWPRKRMQADKAIQNAES
jgi:drug/metabolite transporter (DMT)-like permease